MSTRAITYHVAAGRIEETIKKGNLWLLPVSTDKSADLRFKDNKNKVTNETHQGSVKTI